MFENSETHHRMRWLIVGCLGLGPFLAAGCTQPNQFKPPPPPEITVALPVQQTVTNYLEETGTTEAVEMVQIRARVKGFLEEVNFEPGTIVEEGELLYLIEPQQYAAEVDAAEAELAARNVERKRADIEFERQKNLFADNATSERNVVLAEAEFNAAVAAVDAAEANLAQAKLDLEYTEVRAPFKGRVGKTLVKQGNLVGEGEATHLTTVMKYDPIYANLNISERTFLGVSDESTRQEREEMREKDKVDLPLYLARANDTGFPYEGEFDYAALEVDQSTGTFMIRGIFPNPDLAIVPGLFVRIRIPIGTQEDALLVPERALGGDQTGRYLLVVNSENKVERRDVTAGAKHGELVVIEEGLKPDERVVVDGVQRARPGAVVRPQETVLAMATEAVQTDAQGVEPPPAAPSEDPAFKTDEDDVTSLEGDADNKDAESAGKGTR